CFFFQAEDGIRDKLVTGVQTCALPIYREWFWAKLLEVPPGWFGPEYLNPYGGMSVDGVFGAMIDSRQVRKLPVQWLLLLLVVYRSEERRVGKECRSRWSGDHLK